MIAFQESYFPFLFILRMILIECSFNVLLFAVFECGYLHYYLLLYL